MNVFTREYNYLHVEVYRVLNPSQNLIRNNVADFAQ
jgi:hypothetical protein